MHKRQREKINR